MSAIIYLLQVSACMAIFYGFYYFMLNRLTFFTINRYYLLFTMLLSFVIPLLTIHLHEADNYPHVMQQVVYVNTLQNVQAYTFAAPSPKKIIEPGINWLQVLKMVYWLVAAGLFTHLVIVLIGFFSKLKYRKVDRIGNVNILRGNKKLTNGSFLNYIFLNDNELSADELQQIIAHEMLHVKYLHSVDRIIAKIIQIILWFNPSVYLYARSIEENHEFEVDREIARSTNKNNYADLLLHLSVAKQGMLYHSFSKVPLKKRITMLFNKPSAKMKRVIYIGIIPVVVISCLAFARLKSDDKPNAKKQVDKKLYSVIGGMEHFGENLVVLIDGKEYPAAILYKISGSCLNGWSSGPGNAIEIKKYGPRAKERVIKIKTKNGVITYMTPFQKNILTENSNKEAAVPLTQFYTKLVLKKDDGKLFDEIIIHFQNGSETSSNEHNAKVAFFIDGKRHSEAYIKNLSPAIIAMLKNGGGGVGNPKLHPKRWPNVQDCESVIYFITNKVDPQRLPSINQQKKDAKIGLLQNKYNIITGLQKLGKNPLVFINGQQCSADVLKVIGVDFKITNLYLPAEAIKMYGPKAKDGAVKINTTPIEKENLLKEAAVPLSQFYTRLVLKKADGKPYDLIIVNQKLERFIDSVSHGAKVAFFINKKRYDESAIKNLSPAAIALLSDHENGRSNPKKWPNAADCESVIYFTTATAAKTGSTKAPVQYPPPIVKPEPPRPHVVYSRGGVRVAEPYAMNFMVKNNVALEYLNNNNIAGLEKYLASITDKTELYHAQNEVAWTLALRGEQLEFAEKLSKQSVEIVNNQLEHPVAGRYGTVEQAKESANGDAFMVGDTYAYILYKEGRYAEALKVQQPLYDRLENKGSRLVPEHYAEILAANNNYKKAKEVAEAWIKYGNTSSELEPTLKECYIKIYGSDKGYDEYLAGIKAVSKSNMGMMFNPSTQIGVRSQMRYVTGFSIGSSNIFSGSKKSVMIPNPTGNASYVTDTIEYDAKSYSVKPTDHLADLLKLLPNVTVDEKKAVFFEGKPINKIMLVINNTTVWGQSALLTDAPADRVDKVRIIDPGKKMTMEILMPKVTGTFKVTGDSTMTVKHTN